MPARRCRRAASWSSGGHQWMTVSHSRSVLCVGGAHRRRTRRGRAPRVRSDSTCRPRVYLWDRWHRRDQRGRDQEGPYQLAPLRACARHHVSTVRCARRRGLLSPRRRRRPESARCAHGARETDDAGTLVCVSSVRSCPAAYRRDRMRTDLTPARRAVWWREAGQRAEPAQWSVRVYIAYTRRPHTAQHTNDRRRRTQPVVCTSYPTYVCRSACVHGPAR
jgi:hypothetical protein